MGNRQAAMEVLKLIDLFIPKSPNYEIMREKLEKLNDREFDAYMKKLGSGEETLPYYQPNLTQYKLSVRRNLDIAKKIGHAFFERVWITDAATGIPHLTPEKYLVIDLPIRRQQQLLMKKVSIPDDNMHVDDLSGQPTGVSQGAKLSFPEIQALHAQGMDLAIEELIKFRGGDEGAYRALRREILETGYGRQSTTRPSGSKVKATQTFSILLKAMHIDNNL